MAAWTYQSSGAAVFGASGANIDLSGSAPSGVTVGDLLLLFTGQRGTTTAAPSMTAGWTLLVTNGYSAAGTAEIYGRIATGTAADAPDTVDWAGTSGAVGWLERWSGGGYTDLATIVAHSTSGSGTSTALQLPAFTPATVANCLVVGFSIKNNTATDATLISHSVLTKRTQYIGTVASRVHAASGSLQQTTATDYDGTDFTINGTSESLSNRGVIVYLRTSSLTKKLKLLVHADAQSDASIVGTVFNPPTTEPVHGDHIGQFTGAAFEATLESGKAVLKVPVADFGGSALTTSDTPVALVRNTNDSTSIIAGTVIEE